MNFKNNLNHIAFIMDGNGRWAKKRNLPRIQGHYEGTKRISEIILGCIEHKISVATFFAFSTENWNRPNEEVNYLINLLKMNLTKKNLKWFHKHNIRINLVGFESEKVSRIFNKIKKFCDQTINNNQITVNICFNYSAQYEIINACKILMDKHLPVSKENFEQALMIQAPVDLLIRTSGEERISNFLLYQIAYSEIIFEKTYWPDYKINILEKNLQEFYSRERRFGAINEK